MSKQKIKSESKAMEFQHTNGWAAEEFSNVDLGDKRLNERAVKICDSFSESPESPINQACADWAETKAAYRFFGNDHVDAREILEAHRLKTAERAKKHQTVLAIQDTSYFIYTSHAKTKGLGVLSLNKGKNIEKIFSHGLMMHSCLAVTTEGLPLGLLDQTIFTRKLRTEEKCRFKDTIAIELKESYRWLESLKKTKEIMGSAQVITVCDREADIYEFFELSQKINSPVLVRANVNRAVNKNSRYAEKDVLKLWDYMSKKPVAGTFKLEMPSKRSTKHSKERNARIVNLTLKFGSFRLSPPRNNMKHRSSKLPDIDMHAIHVFETNPPKGEEPVEWMLITNLKVTNFDEAYEKILWYALRWRIEMYFKVLKSGFRVEECRLGKADRLVRYLTVMSIVAWRLFMITLIARTHPDTSCTKFLADHEWKILFLKVNKNKKLPEQIPIISEVVIWIARLGGFLARKCDGAPGTITLWRGWKRLTDLADGWNLAIQSHTCG